MDNSGLHHISRRALVCDVGSGVLALFTILNNAGVQRSSAITEQMGTGISDRTEYLHRGGFDTLSGNPMSSRISLIVLTEAR